jgi:hypothetical protein
VETIAAITGGTACPGKSGKSCRVLPAGQRIKGYASGMKDANATGVLNHFGGNAGLENTGENGGIFTLTEYCKHITVSNCTGIG